MAPRDAQFVSRFKSSITKSLGAHKAGMIFDAYNITDAVSNDESYTNILDFGNDIKFLAPVLVYAHGWDGNAFVYFFNEPNTWEGPWAGRANHILDAAYLFQNYNDHLSPGQKETAVEFGKDLINFANGHHPWPVFEFAAKKINAKVYGAKNPKSTEVKSRTEVVPGPNPRTERRQSIFALSTSIPLSRLSEAWDAFVAGE
jgi:hypothetical protein